MRQKKLQVFQTNKNTKRTDAANLSFSLAGCTNLQTPSLTCFKEPYQAGSNSIQEQDKQNVYVMTDKNVFCARGRLEEEEGCETHELRDGDQRHTAGEMIQTEVGSDRLGRC